MLKVKYENTDIDAAYIALHIVNKKFLLKKKWGKYSFHSFFPYIFKYIKYLNLVNILRVSEIGLHLLMVRRL